MKRNFLHFTQTFLRNSAQVIFTSIHTSICNVSELNACIQHNVSFRPANRLLRNTPAHV